MTRPHLIAIIAALVATSVAGPARAQAPALVADTEARTPDEERKGFHLPEGFAIELVASEPQIHKPMNLAFDARGRLWVSSTVEYPVPVAEGARGRDKVLILSDLGPDGKARKVETFADGLNIPIGLLPLGGGDRALIHDIPTIRRFADETGDGSADRSDVAYARFGFRDTHGMTNSFTPGFDGWIYACHGFSNESEVAGSDGKKVVMQSGNVYRMTPDGSGLAVFSHGQVNPFGLAFDPMGRLYSADCHTRPIYQLIRGAYYPSFGKPDDGLGYGPEMVNHDHGSTGIGGVAYYAAEHFPPEFRDNAFLGNVVTSRINRDRVDWQGSSPRGVEQPDFVVSDDPWFRPVDIELGPDGALYVADFYNRIIGHYEVPLDHPGRDRERGRIWRIVYKGKDGQAPPPVDPRPDAASAPSSNLVADLDSPNLAVRIRATNLLVDRGGAGAELASTLAGPGAFAAAHALWALHRLGKLDDDSLGRAARRADEVVRVHAARVVGDRPDWSDRDLDVISALLADPSPHVRRAAIEALALHPSPERLRTILDFLKAVDPSDDHLRHATRIALRAPLLIDETWKRMSLGPDDEAAIADVALGVPSAESGRFLLAYLARHPDRADRRDRFVRHVARHVGPEAEAGLVRLVEGSGYDGPTRVGLLKAIDQGSAERGASAGPEVRKVALATVLGLVDSARSADVLAAIDLIGALRLDAASAVEKIAADPGREPSERSAAMKAWGASDPAGSTEGLARIYRDGSEKVDVREQAARLLAGSNRADARARLVEGMASSPARLETEVARDLAITKDGASALFDAVRAGKASPRLLAERSVAVRFPQSNLPGWQDTVSTLTKDMPAADARLAALLLDRRNGFDRDGGDPSKGASVFARNCAGCHQIGGQGGRVGPQLDGVGVRGLDRLMEDVLDPNRNVDQAFRATTLALSDGRVMTGLLLRQDGEVLVMADAEGKEVRVESSKVEDRKVGQASPMPASFADLVEPADFRHLMAYLLSNRPEGVPIPRR